MLDLYINQILKRVVAEIFQRIGWDAIESTPMDMLISILDKYLKEITRSAQKYTEIGNRNQGSVEDIILAFDDMHINLKEINEYMENVEPAASLKSMHQITIKKKSNFNFLPPNNTERYLRPAHVYSYLPPMPQNQYY